MTTPTELQTLSRDEIINRILDGGLYDCINDYGHLVNEITTLRQQLADMTAAKEDAERKAASYKSLLDIWYPEHEIEET